MIKDYGNETWMTRDEMDEPERERAFKCDCCDRWLYRGEEYMDAQGYILCEECADDVSTLLELLKATKNYA